MVKCAGCGHDPAGVGATQPGECAVECPVCPHLGRNLPEGWEDAPNYIKCVVIFALSSRLLMRRSTDGFTH